AVSLLCCRLFCSFVFLLLRAPPRPPLFPYTTLFRSRQGCLAPVVGRHHQGGALAAQGGQQTAEGGVDRRASELVNHQPAPAMARSEEHTSELHSLTNLVCRLLLEKKKQHTPITSHHS